MQNLLGALEGILFLFIAWTLAGLIFAALFMLSIRLGRWRRDRLVSAAEKRNRERKALARAL